MRVAKPAEFRGLLENVVPKDVHQTSMPRYVFGTCALFFPLFWTFMLCKWLMTKLDSSDNGLCSKNF